ncbi:EAL domain-containing protein [Bosea sp. (in: a-proteobacteria)]|uniref:putative bifunctional diguanylate cyclase/phosphodiesterase n=1 Tax=Bosea sp. (in: a-proteobacteria) TaxID=1871050 RepID=UPI00262A7DB1|nr:EAL domain-containing protein [Bosea sp. (in: a-proteobacteria)]MCO5092245.1 EAL domain-containing protein [Bosea sp. (in: a-proteobacteria)]
MFANTIVTLGCAFLLLMAAGIAVVVAITREANRLEAQRQGERIEAAVNAQMRLGELRLERLVAAGDLPNALHQPGAEATPRATLERLSGQLMDFDGAYIGGAGETVLAWVENPSTADHPAQAIPHHLDALQQGVWSAFVAPAGTGAAALPGAARSTIVTDGGEVLILTAVELPQIASPAGAAPAPLFFVAYRHLTDALLADLAAGNRIAGIHLVSAPPADPLSRLNLRAADGTSAAWLAWSPARPGDVMLRRFLWALIAVALLFSAVFIFVVQRLSASAEQIALRERQIQHLAGQDELSLLPNRRSFDLTLDQTLAHIDENGPGLAVLLIDLDRFKAVNDTYGHTAGDELIRQVAARLSGAARIGDTVARLGGDEFGVIQTRSATPSGSKALGERILAALTEPFMLAGVEVTIGCSIGIAMALRDGTSREALLKRADTALYEAKNSGRNRYAFFESQMNRSLQLKRMVEDDLRQAIDNDQLVLHYQPQVSIDGSAIVGVEALVRWPHPVHGLIPPSEFIAIAEERGLIVPLSEWVLRRACTEARRWKGLRLAVNVSPIQFRHRDFVANVIRTIAETDFDPARLELELTEGVLIEDADAAETAMMNIRAHGVGLALDDFGTGYSSLIYLRRFAFDKIKIDRSFLEYMEATGESAILVHSMAHLGRALGLRVCAEGVETAGQRRFLQAIGCHELQGFLFSKAVPASEIDHLLSLDNPFAEVLAAA